MWERFKSLSLIWKVLIGVGLLILCVLIYDFSTGGMRNLKNWMFDKRQAVVEQEILELENKNKALREENAELIKQAEMANIKLEALDAQIEAVGGKLEANAEATQKALEEVYREEAITAQPTDAKTRCIRLKAKLIALNIPSAKEMNCDEIN